MPSDLYKGEPVPQPSRNTNQPWFYPNSWCPGEMCRKAAEDILQRVPLNGAFLVRYASERTQHGRFVISFRMEKEIKHCRLREEGRLLIVNPKQKFESIEQLVEFYFTHPFYKGLKLRNPVTEELIKFSETAGNPNSKVYTHPDYYLNTNTPVLQVRAILPFSPDGVNALGCPDVFQLLRFEKEDIITNVKQHDGRWWEGELTATEKGYFPCDYVEEVKGPGSLFGELRKGSVVLGKASLIPERNDEEFPYIINVGDKEHFEAAFTNRREAEEWKNVINATFAIVRNQNAESDKHQKKHKLAKEFSQLIVYCCAVPQMRLEILCRDGRICNEIRSFSETSARRGMWENPIFYLWYHEIQLSRVYPSRQRIDSSNFIPSRFWNYGCQMVALNYQKPDKGMQIYHGLFRPNGKCGYVLRPDFMFKRSFDPKSIKDLTANGIRPLHVNMAIIAARHLTRTGNKPILNPFVEVEIFGVEFDCQSVRIKKFAATASNGFNPFWNEALSFTVWNPDLALIRFGVMDEDSFGDTHFIGQATYPPRLLRQGYRSVPLLNGFGEDQLGTLLIHLNISEV